MTGEEGGTLGLRMSRCAAAAHTSGRGEALHHVHVGSVLPASAQRNVWMDSRALGGREGGASHLPAAALSPLGKARSPGM